MKAFRFTVALCFQYTYTPRKSPIVSEFPSTLVTDRTTAKPTAKRQASSCLFSLPLVLWTISSFGGESRQAHTGRGLKPRNSVRTVYVQRTAAHTPDMILFIPAGLALGLWKLHKQSLKFTTALTRIPKYPCPDKPCQQDRFAEGRN